MNRVEQIEKLSVVGGKLKALREKVAKLVEEQSDLYSRTTVTCANGHPHEIRDLVYLQTHWYVSPHGCTGGDYHRPGEGQYVCPTCGKYNRLYDKPEIEALKPYFKSVTDVY